MLRGQQIPASICSNTKLSLQLEKHTLVSRLSMSSFCFQPLLPLPSAATVQAHLPAPLRAARSVPSVSPAHHELQGVGEDPVEDESKAGS